MIRIPVTKTMLSAPHPRPIPNPTVAPTRGDVRSEAPLGTECEAAARTSGGGGGGGGIINASSDIGDWGSKGSTYGNDGCVISNGGDCHTSDSFVSIPVCHGSLTVVYSFEGRLKRTNASSVETDASFGSNKSPILYKGYIQKWRES